MSWHVDLNDVQTIVLKASRRRFVVHAIVQFASAEMGRRYLIELEGAFPEAIHYGARRAAGGCVDLSIGLTFAGLEMLAVPDVYLSVFRRLSRAFADGAAVRAASHLGDIGASAANHWDDGFKGRRAHALLTVHANDPGDIEAAKLRLTSALQIDAKSASKLHFGPVGEVLGPPPCRDDKPPEAGSWVHFGYRDGLSRARIRGLDGNASSVADTEDAQVHEPGELLLGETRDIGDNPWFLPGRPKKFQTLFRHGSFGVLRQIEQHTDKFDAAVASWAKRLQHDGSIDIPEDFVRAKLCGRWPGGALIGKHDPAKRIKEPTDPPVPNADFSNDEHGHGCPFGAHIRRMNPNGVDSVHMRPGPLFRRGLPYGPWPDPKGPIPDGKSRGLLGLFFCADIEDQFEHLLGEWADRSPLGTPGTNRAKDPLIGAHDNPFEAFEIPREGRPALVLEGLTPFVTTRGTLYAFYPSREALALLRSADWDADSEPWDDR